MLWGANVVGGARPPIRGQSWLEGWRGRRGGTLSSSEGGELLEDSPKRRWQVVLKRKQRQLHNSVCELG